MRTKEEHDQGTRMPQNEKSEPERGIAFDLNSAIPGRNAYLWVMPKRAPKDLPKWRVTRIVGPKAREICELRAESADAAIKLAVREYEIEPEKQNRLAAYRVA